MREHLGTGGMILAATHGPLGIECEELQLGSPAPFPLEGDGWGGGSGGVASAGQLTTIPTPSPSPQGGGEQHGARGSRT